MENDDITVPSEFYIEIEKGKYWSNKASDWYLKSFSFKKRSYDYQICMLFCAKYRKKAMFHDKKVAKILKRIL